MKKRIFLCLGTLVLTVFFHLATMMAAPNVIMAVARKKLEKAGVKANRIYHAEPITAKDRRVVRPSPDLIYSIIDFDVRHHNLRITATIPNTYWSLSMFARDTENFYTLNDRQCNAENITVVLKQKGEVKPKVDDRTIIVKAETDTGIILLRMFIDDPQKLDDLIAVQKRATCEVMARR